MNRICFAKQNVPEPVGPSLELEPWYDVKSVCQAQRVELSVANVFISMFSMTR